MTDIDPLIQRHTTTQRTASQHTRARVAGQASPSRRKRRRHPATGARIVAAGLGASTMFGLVAAMGIASAAASSSQAATTPNTVTPGTVSPGTIAPDTVAPNTVAPNTVAPNAGQAPAATGPIVLQARPQVSVVNPAPAPAAPAPAPAAVTSGSA